MLCPSNFVKMYWRTFFVLIFPIISLPIFVFHDTKAFRCMYAFAMMCAFWITEAIPPPITSLLPMVLFPLMGILGSDQVAENYMNDTNMMLCGSVAIAIAMENTGLHVRIALYVIKLIGCGIKRLHIGLAFVTMFISMWIANTAATALMLPIVEGTLLALQNQGLIKMWKEPGRGKRSKEEDDLRPTNITMCYYITAAYSSSIGGTGCIIGSGSHLAFKGLYENRFPNSPGVEFAKWMMLNVPIMLLCNILMILWLQFIFLGLGRPYSKAAKQLAIGKEAAETTKTIIKEKIEDLGPIKFSEVCVGLCFMLAIVLWFFRRPGFMNGWPFYLTDVKCGDAVVAITVLIIFVLLPIEPSFLYFRSNDEQNRPIAPSESLLTWKLFASKMQWGMLFVLGGGFAMADGARESGMTKLIAEFLEVYLYDEKLLNLLIFCSAGFLITQFLSSNVACVTILIPIINDVAVQKKIHPLYLGLPCALACSYSYFLPVSTPPNALVAGPSKMGAKEMMLSGVGTFIACAASLLIVFPLYAPLIYDFTFPYWVK